MKTLVVLLLALACVAMADKLYPRCGGKLLTADLSPGDSATLSTPSVDSGRLIADCVAFDVKAEAADGAKCLQSGTDGGLLAPGLHIYLQAEYTKDGKDITTTWDMRETVGGSVQQIKYSVPSKSAVWQFRAGHEGTSCRYRVRALFEYKGNTESADERQEPLPALTAVAPATVYAKAKNPTFFMFKLLNPGQEDKLTLLNGNGHCANSGADGATIARSNHMAYVRAKGREPKDPNMHTYWSHTFENPGNYRLCYKHESLGYEEVAVVTVFGGNPSYFVLTEGTGRQGQVFLNVPTTARFYGDELDQRPDGDQAKFVDDANTCEGPAAGGSGVATDLGPWDDYGSNTTFADWTFTLTKPGVYRVCYKRKGQRWIEVVSYDDLPQSARHGTPAPLGNVPIPTSAITKQNCPTAPPRDDQPEEETYLVLTVDNPVLPFGFRADLAQLLCIPHTVVDMIRVVASGGKNIVTLDLVCKGYDISAPCSGPERKNMLLYMFVNKNKDLVQGLRVSNVEEIGAKGFVSVTDDIAGPSTSGKSGGSTGTVLVCFTVIALAVMGIYAFKRYQDNTHHFIQFGLDENDADDFEEDGNAPAPVARRSVGDSQSGTELA